MSVINLFFQFTHRVIQQYRIEHPTQWITFENNFEREKCRYSPDTYEVAIQCPNNFATIYEKITKAKLENTLSKDDWPTKVKITDCFLILKPKAVNMMFQIAIDKITSHTKTLLTKKELKGVKALLLVGGFSESKVVTNGIKSAFDGYRVLVPPNAKISVLKGAVMFGHDPNIISMRISPYTYGVHTRVLYDATRHATIKPKQLQDGRRVVENSFHKHLTIREQVYVDQATKEANYKSVGNLKNVFWKVYQSELKDPILCDGQCRYIGRLNVDIPTAMQGSTLNLNMTMTCIGSELEAKVVVGEGKNTIVCCSKFEFLNIDMSMPGSVEVDELGL